MIKEFDILGQKVRLTSDPETEKTSPDEIVDYVREVASKIKDSAPNLDCGKIFLLTALKIAEERIDISSEYKENIDVLQSSVTDALGFIDQATIQ